MTKVPTQLCQIRDVDVSNRGPLYDGAAVVWDDAVGNFILSPTGVISATNAVPRTAGAAAGIPFDESIKNAGLIAHSSLGANPQEITVDADGTVAVSFSASIEAS